MGAPPRIKQGSSLTFMNADQQLAIRHSVTTCRWPCNGPYVTNYPLADGRWDSGTLGFDLGRRRQPGPAAQTPNDLASREVRLLLPDPPLDAGRVRSGRVASRGRTLGHGVRSERGSGRANLRRSPAWRRRRMLAELDPDVEWRPHLAALGGRRSRSRRGARLPRLARRRNGTTSVRSSSSSSMPATRLSCS